MSYASANKHLSDKTKFPSFLRTLASDEHQASAYIQLVQTFGWVYVGTLAADDDFGRPAVAQFIQEAEDIGACIAFHRLLPKVNDALIISDLGELYYIR